METEAVEKIFQKKSKKSEQFGAFLERYLFGDDHRLKKNFVKKFKKIPPMGRFLERYLFGSECDFSWIVKNPEKSQKFSGQFHFFLEDTCLGQSGQNTGFRKEKSKKV